MDLLPMVYFSYLPVPVDSHLYLSNPILED